MGLILFNDAAIEFGDGFLGQRDDGLTQDYMCPISRENPRTEYQKFVREFMTILGNGHRPRLALEKFWIRDYQPATTLSMTIRWYDEITDDSTNFRTVMKKTLDAELRDLDGDGENDIWENSELVG